MPNTRASTSRLVPKRKLRREDAASGSDDDFHDPNHKDVEAETGFIVDNLREAISGVGKVHAHFQFLEQENQRLRTELREVRKNASGNERRSVSSREKASWRRIQSLERKIADLEAAHEKDRRIIKKLRNTEVQQDAQDLAADRSGTTQTLQTVDLGESAIKLLRRMCDTVDMNTLAEKEDCAVCLEEMETGKCYREVLVLPCRHPVCIGCFERLGDGSNTPSNDRTNVQCPHCRNIYSREDCEIITHNAMQQWDLLLEISQEWATKDIGEIDIGEDDNDSFIEDGSVVAAQSPPDSSEAGDRDTEHPTGFTSPNDNEQVAYNNLPSPMKRKRLTELVAQRATKPRA